MNSAGPLQAVNAPGSAAAPAASAGAGSSTLLRGGTVVDGSGRAAYAADLRLQGQRIEAIAAQLDARAGETVIDCRGKIVAPGFIDVHTHDDALVLTRPDMLPKISQGISTVIVGNCGISLAPLVTPTPISPLDLLDPSQFRHASMASYAQAVDQAQPSVNVGALLGHTSVRARVMPELNHAANESERQAMQALVEQAMEDGALGLSSGIFYHPAYAADIAELSALAKAVAAHQGVYVTHIRDEMQDILKAIQEAADTASLGRLPLVISHHKCAGAANWGRAIETLALIDRLHAKQSIHLDVYPYTAGSTVLREDLVDGVIDILITRSEPHPEMVGRYLTQIAEQWGVSQREACLRLKPGGACYFQMHEDDVRRVIAHPRTMIGSDGLPHDEKPHPRLWGAFPRVLAQYAREHRLLSLEEAIRKMTGLSAWRFGLHQRGQLQPGWFADVVVFDAERIEDRATYEKPHEVSTGIEAVFVNGVLSYTAQGLTGQRAGRFLRRQTQGQVDASGAVKSQG